MTDHGPQDQTIRFVVFAACVIATAICGGLMVFVDWKWHGVVIAALTSAAFTAGFVFRDIESSRRSSSPPTKGSQ